MLTTEEGVILIDDKFERSVPEILENVKALTPRPVRYVINTHHHGDHTGGNARLMESADVILKLDDLAGWSMTGLFAKSLPGPLRQSRSLAPYQRNLRFTW